MARICYIQVEFVMKKNTNTLVTVVVVSVRRTP